MKSHSAGHDDVATAGGRMVDVDAVFTFSRWLRTRPSRLMGVPSRVGSGAAGSGFSPFTGSAALCQFCNEDAERHELVNTSAAVGEDGWAQLAPFGDFGGEVRVVHADGRVEGPKPAIQRMDRAAAEALVADFRRPWSRLLRWAKGLPIFNGHPDQPGKGHQYPDRGEKGVIADLQVRDDGLFARPVFNNEGRRLLESQPGLAFSARWNALPAGTTADGVTIFRPSELLSAGLTRNPNLPVQAVNEAPMDLAALIAALKRLGITIADDADLAAITAAITAAAEQAEAAKTQAANDRAALATTNAELANVRTQLTTTQGQVTTLRGELVNERAARATLLIDGAIREGRITEADRAGYVTQFANDFAAATAALAAAKPRTALPNQSRVGAAANLTASTATIQERRWQALQLINDREKTTGETFDQAYAAVLKARPELFGVASGS